MFTRSGIHRLRSLAVGSGAICAVFATTPVVSCNPPRPVLTAIAPSQTSDASVTVTGATFASATVTVDGGALPAQAGADASGSYSVSVPLHQGVDRINAPIN